MAYATPQDLINVIPKRDQRALTDDDLGDGLSSNNAVLSFVLSSAESRINSALARRYSLPLDTVPNAIKGATLTIAKHYLYQRRDIPSESVRDGYEDTIKWLDKVATGQLDIPELESGSTEAEDIAVTGFASGSAFGENQVWGI